MILKVFVCVYLSLVMNDLCRKKLTEWISCSPNWGCFTRTNLSRFVGGGTSSNMATHPLLKEGALLLYLYQWRMPVEGHSWEKNIFNKQRTSPLKGTSKTMPELACQNPSEMQGPWSLCAPFLETDNASTHLPTCLFIYKAGFLWKSSPIQESLVPHWERDLVREWM